MHKKAHENTQKRKQAIKHFFGFQNYGPNGRWETNFTVWPYSAADAINSRGHVINLVTVNYLQNSVLAIRNTQKDHHMQNRNNSCSQKIGETTVHISYHPCLTVSNVITFCLIPLTAAIYGPRVP